MSYVIDEKGRLIYGPIDRVDADALASMWNTFATNAKYSVVDKLPEPPAPTALS